MGSVYESCGCGAEWVGHHTQRDDRAVFREAHRPCREAVEAAPNPDAVTVTLTRKAANQIAGRIYEDLMMSTRYDAEMSAALQAFDAALPSTDREGER